jgi:hypothetical protein
VAALDLVPHLIDAAREGHKLTYKELADKVDTHWRPVPLRLGYIRDELCVPNGLPMISAIVVNQDTKLPGYSFLPNGTEGLTPQEYAEAAAAEQRRVFEYANWNRLQALADHRRVTV